MSATPQGANPRYTRPQVSRPATVQAGERLLHGEALDVGPQGAKLRLPEQLDVGTRVSLQLTPAEDHAIPVEAIVWRVDEDGVVFFFLSTDSGAGERDRGEAGTRGLAPSSRCTETILVVDDEREVLSVAVDTLETQGYAVLQTVDPFEALKMARRSAEPIDLLLTDVVMPLMHGVKLADEFRAIRPGAKVLFMSAYITEQVEDHGALLVPGVSLLVKPFGVAALLDRVRSVLDYRSPIVREPRRAPPRSSSI